MNGLDSFKTQKPKYGLKFHRSDPPRIVWCVAVAMWTQLPYLLRLPQKQSSFVHPESVAMALFDSAVNLEESHYKEGYDEGYKDGQITGKEEGRQVGLKTGFEVGEELGFYRGCVDLWNSAIQIDPNCFSSRVKLGIKQMKELLEKYPIMDPENLQVQEIMNSLRLKFKMVVITKKMLKMMLACCKVYISESRNKSALDAIERAAKLFPQAPIVNKFEDEAYNRVGYTLVSKLAPTSYSEPCHLTSAVHAMMKAAFDTIDFEMHCGTHPRLGVVDHVCFHPLGDTSLNEAARTARFLARNVGSDLQAPTFLYGAAHEEGRTLDLIRRELGYFKPNARENQWIGGPKANFLPLKPDSGPAQASPTKGVVVIGSTQWVDNYNVPLFSADISAVRRIAKWVSGRGGGLPFVQAMALAHGEGIIEVACNLLDSSKVGGDRVQEEVERLAREEGISVGKGYFTDYSQEEIIQKYLMLGQIV